MIDFLEWVKTGLGFGLGFSVAILLIFSIWLRIKFWIEDWTWKEHRTNGSVKWIDPPEENFTPIPTPAPPK